MVFAMFGGCEGSGLKINMKEWKAQGGNRDLTIEVA
jgi:hypothetical protein